jgi:Immunity protein 44
MDKDEKSILGCFVSEPMDDELADTFRAYIWGEKGICDALKTLEWTNYGADMRLVLFKFRVNPIPYELQHLEEIEKYSKKEKAIGISIIIDEDNFFSKSEAGKYEVLKTTILQKIDILAEVVKKKKLDTNVALLKSDLEGMFKFIP